MKFDFAHPLRRDLDDIVQRRASLWESIDHGKFFVTGGTGFIGSWLLESLFWARRSLDLDVEVTVLTRDPALFLSKVPSLSSERGLDFLRGDVRSFEFPKKQFTHVIHAATAASAKLNAEQPLEMIDTIVTGAKRVFEFSGMCGARVVLHTSSGGVYGSQPLGMQTIPEDYQGAPDPLDKMAAYSEGKRLAEMIGSIEANRFGFQHKVARITALVGPRLPLDIHYAMGNFLRDALQGGPILIRGDGSPVRSYMYIADLVSWLWVILANGISNRAYNAGSELGISLMDAANAVNRAAGGKLEIKVERKVLNDGRPNRYVPSTARAQLELGLAEWTDLDMGIAKTLEWHHQILGHGLA